MDLYAYEIIADLEGVNNKCMQDYKRLLLNSTAARSAVFKFFTERMIPVIADVDGCRNYPALPPIKEEDSDEVLQELLSVISTSAAESGSTYGENVQILTVTPGSEGDLSVAYDTEYVSSEQEDSYSEEHEVYYVPLTSLNIPYQEMNIPYQEMNIPYQQMNIPYQETERLSTSLNLETKQEPTNLRHDLYQPQYYYYKEPEYVQAEYVDEDLYQNYNPTQQFYYDCDIPLQQEDDGLYYYDVNNLQYALYPDHYRYIHEQPKPSEEYYGRKPRNMYQNYETSRTPDEYIRNGAYRYGQLRKFRKPITPGEYHRQLRLAKRRRRYESTRSRPYYEQAPSGHSSHQSYATYTPGYPTYYENPETHYNSTSFSPCYTTDPTEVYFGYVNYPQFEENRQYFDPHEDYGYEIYPEEDTCYY